MNELKEMLMEQLQLLHEHSKHGCCIPGELVDLSNAMANIAEVVVRIGDDMNGTGLWRAPVSRRTSSPAAARSARQERR